jgi:hypothetical protein
MQIWTVSDSTYRDFTLDANGRANVSKTGISKFGARGGLDFSDATVPTGNNQCLARWADYGGTTTDPKLVITYTTSTNYTLTATQASFTETGEAVAFGIKMLAAYASYALTGFTVALAKGRALVAAFGSFVLTGEDSLFHKTLSMTAAYASYALTGIAATFGIAISMAATVASYVLTGKAVRLLLNGISQAWADQTKHSSSYINQTKNSSSWTDQDKS